MLLTLPLRGEVNALSDGNLQPFAFFSRHTCSPLQLFLFTSLMLKHIHLDIVGPVPLSEGCTYIITFIDRFSHWPEAIPVQDISTETVAHTLVTHWIARFGMPKILTTDQSRQFESHLFSALRKILGIWHIQVAPYHSCINKMIEKFHCSLHRFTSAIMIFTGMKSYQLCFLVFPQHSRKTLGVLVLRCCIEQHCVYQGNFYILLIAHYRQIL